MKSEEQEMTEAELGLVEELRQVRPGAVPPALREAVEVERSKGKGRPKEWIWIGLQTSGALAACLLVAVAIVSLGGPFESESPIGEPAANAIASLDSEPIRDPLDSAERESEDSHLVPVGYWNELQNRSDEGLLQGADGAWSRQWRYRYLDTVVVEDQRDGARIKFTVPREEIRLVRLLAM